MIRPCGRGKQYEIRKFHPVVPIGICTLLVRSGLLRVEIALNSIQQVFPEPTSRGAPAWSLDRLRVDYSKAGLATFVHISRQDKFQSCKDGGESLRLSVSEPGTLYAKSLSSPRFDSDELDWGYLFLSRSTTGCGRMGSEKFLKAALNLQERVEQLFSDEE